MPLTVLSIGYSFAPVGPGCVGGAEQILTVLDQALAESGNDSLVLACGGSTTAGRLFTLPAICFGSGDEVGENRWQRSAQASLDSVVSRNRIDLIHMHGFDFHRYRLPEEIPVLVTLHLPFSWYPAEIWKDIPANVRLQCVSEAQRRSCPSALRDIAVIANGVELPAKEEEEKGGEFAMTLGRICPEKNQHVALEAGFDADTPVLLGGRVFPWKDHQRYFHERIEPLLAKKRRATQHEFAGAISSQTRQRLLRQAKCLLHPTLAPETSSLVAMEALAAGTPVIAYRSGALPEIVEDGVTGFLVSSREEMADALRRVRSIDPDACRASAARRFSKERMIAQYFSLYREIVRQPAEVLHA